MANQPNTGIVMALLGGAALFAFGSGAPSKQGAIPASDPRSPLLNIYGPIGKAYPRQVPPEEIMLLYREHRPGQEGPIGSTRIWTIYSQVHAENSLEDIGAHIGEHLVTVQVRPEWIKEDTYGSVETIPVLIRPEHVHAIIPGKITEIGRGQLAELQFANGALLDIVQTVQEAQCLFPNAIRVTTRPR